MNEHIFNLDDFQGEVRLFPLPNLVHFPWALQPLHIFEPRYRQMTADALTSDQLITMVLLRDGWDSDELGNPAIHDVACLGRVLAHHCLPDGRYDLMLFGLRRVRILEELESEKLYRTAHVELLDEQVPSVETARTLTEELRCQAAVWDAQSTGTPPLIPSITKVGFELAVVCDLLAFLLPLPMSVKQELLHEVDVEQRALRLRKFLMESVHPSSAPKTFPPLFSRN